MKRALSLMLALILFLPCLPAALSEAAPSSANLGIFVDPISGLSKDFLFAADVSSILALEKSGVQLYDWEEKPGDLFAMLKAAGFTAARVRIWNDPFDSEGHGYGGGNSDLAAACEIARRCAAQGLKLMVDFHYSDFWADPSKQQCPQAWEGMDVDEKAQALGDFTRDSLLALEKTGVTICLVQIGNETDNGIAGETNRMSMAKLLNAGSAAVRETLPTCRVAVHFSQPDLQFPHLMKMFMVDYDVMGYSYYPYWHGSLDNLETVLRETLEKYGKETLVLETSYCYTEENGDFHTNSVPAIGTVHSFANTVQGQANALRAVTKAAVGGGALGICYWEPAWLPVPGETKEAQAALWEEYGSGWASSYASEYDPEDAGQWYGGSSWDNQALFDFAGHPLATLRFPTYAYTGATTTRRVDSYDSPILSCFIDDGVYLPETVDAVYNDGSIEPVPVTWDAARVGEMLQKGLGEFEIQGIADGHPVTCVLTVTAENFLQNPGFEDGVMSMWTVTNLGTEELGRRTSINDIKSGDGLFHFYSSTGQVEFRVEQTVTGLRDGLYDFSLYIHGGDVDESDMYIYVLVDGKEYASAPMSVTKWREWQHPLIEKIPVTGGEITVGAYVRATGKGPWGKLDDWMLNLSREP